MKCDSIHTVSSFASSASIVLRPTMGSAIQDHENTTLLTISDQLKQLQHHHFHVIVKFRVDCSWKGDGLLQGAN